MPLKMLDAGWPASTPAGVIADCKALGAQVVALYDANWSAVGATRTAAFLDAIDQGGIPVIPICTPSNTPPDTAQQVLQIMTSQGLKHTFCAFDLETYSFPPVAWMKACVDLLHGAGWKVIGYGFQSTKNAYAGCGFDYWWGVISYAQPYGYVPSWCDAFQYYDKLIGPSGATYDGSTVGDAMAAAFLADPSPTPIPSPVFAKEHDVISAIRPPDFAVGPGVTDTYDVDPSGKLWHAVFAGETPEYNEALPGEWEAVLRAGCDVGKGQVYVQGRGTDGHLYQMTWWETNGKGGWNGPYLIVN